MCICKQFTYIIKWSKILKIEHDIKKKKKEKKEIITVRSPSIHACQPIILEKGSSFNWNLRLDFLT